MLSGVGAKATTQSKHPKDAYQTMQIQGIRSTDCPRHPISQPDPASKYHLSDSEAYAQFHRPDWHL